MALISSNANISAIKMDEQGDAPATPGSADWKLYFKSDGLYVIDDEGTETGPLSATGGGAAVATDTIWAAKGDLAIGTADNAAAILSVGTDGHVLTADSAQATGIKWAAAAGGLATDTAWAAAGDIAYATGDNAGTVLSIGTVGHVLTVSAGTIPAWAAASGGSGSGAKISRATSQTIAATTDVAIQFTSEDNDDGDYADLGANNTRLTAPADGWYLVTAQTNFDATARLRYFHIRRDGTAFLYSINHSIGDWRANVNGIVYLSEDQYLEAVAWNDSEGSIDNASFAIHSLV